MPFKPGASGNPSGRPVGSRSKLTLAVEKIIEDKGEEIAKKAADLALGGDTSLIRLCLDRLAPARKDRHIPFNLPEMKTPADAAAAAAAIAVAVGEGELTPSEAADLSQFVANYAKALEVTDLAARLERLEANAPGRK
jgi:hypothetical protein